MKKKVLFFLDGVVGGAERMTITIGKMLPRKDFDVKFVVVMDSLGDIQSFIPCDYPVMQIRIKHIWYWGTIRIASLIRREKPYAVFCSMMYLNARVIIAAKLVGDVKIVVRNNNYMNTTRFDQHFLCRISYPFADAIISQQKEMADDIINDLHIDAQKVHILNNPLDIDSIEKGIRHIYDPYPINIRKKYLWVGRVAHNKGQDIAIKAFIDVHRQEPDSHLYFVGKYNDQTDYYKGLMFLVQKHNLSDFVHFQGFDSNPYRWIMYCDCFVLPSRIEGLPNTLIEAQYLGKPAAASRCIPIIERIITEGETGYTAPSESPQELAKAMLKASKLGEIKMTYQSADKETFIKLFN